MPIAPSVKLLRRPVIVAGKRGIQLTPCTKVRLMVAFSADIVPNGVNKVLLFGVVRTEESLGPRGPGGISLPNFGP
jgi:hypothetical protein